MKKLILVGAIVLIGAAAAFYLNSAQNGNSGEKTRNGNSGTASIADVPASSAAPVDSRQLALTCLGRIEPADGVIKVGARSISGQPSLVADLRIKEGDRVHRGEIIAVLDSKAELEAVWHQAEAQVAVGRTRLEQTKTGAKPADVAAQQAEIARLEAQLKNAQAEYNRKQTLFQQGITSASALDVAHLPVETGQELLNGAKERLHSLAAVREVDVAVAEAELEASAQQTARAKAEYENSLIRSPIDGQVLRIHAWPGEEVGPEGIAELAKTDTMYVLAEVPETSLSLVKIGQQANISGAGLKQELSGSVEYITMTVGKNEILPMDPAAFSDSRVVEVRIRLKDSKAASGLIHGRVTVFIKF